LEVNNKVEADSDDEIDLSAVKKSYTIDDITQSMGKQMKISKHKKGADKQNITDEDMGVTKSIVKVNKASLLK